MAFLLVAAMIVLFAIAAYRQAKSQPAEETEEDRVFRCVQCGYDLRGTPYRCPECGADVVPPLDRWMLGAEWPADAIKPRVPTFDEEPEMVHLTSDPVESNLLVEQLNVRGIAARREFVGGGIDMFGDRLPIGFRVMVWSGDADAARAYVNCLRERRRERMFPVAAHGADTDTTAPAAEQEVHGK